MSEDRSDLDAQTRSADPDRWLSSRFIGDPAARADVIAIYAFDHELARAPRVASNPLLGEIRLTWWREVLDEIFEGRTVRRHPTAQALAEAVRRRGLTREPLEAMVDGRYRELDPEPMTGEEAKAWAEQTAGSAAHAVAQALGAGTPEAAVAPGAAWGLYRRMAANPEASWRPVLEALRRAGRDVRLEPEAFPAIAHAALITDGREPTSGLAAQLKLVWAVARGRV